MFHLVLQIIQVDFTLSFKIILPDGILIHYYNLQRFFASMNIECKWLVPNRCESAFLNVSLDFLSFNGQDGIRIWWLTYIHWLEISCFNYVHCQDATFHNAKLVKFFGALFNKIFYIGQIFTLTWFSLRTISSLCLLCSAILL